MSQQKNFLKKIIEKFRKWKIERSWSIPPKTPWKRVLNALYEYQPHQYGETGQNSFYHDDHPLARYLKIKGSKLGAALSILREQELIKQDISSRVGTPYFATVLLTSKGFDVALRNQESTNSERFQEALVITAALPIFSALGLYVLKNFPSANPVHQISWILSVIFIGISLIFLFWMLAVRVLQIFFPRLRY